MKTIKFSVAMLLICFASTLVIAQNKYSFQPQKGSLLWNVNLGGGYTSIIYDNTSLNNSSISFESKIGCESDLNLSYLFSDAVGISLGVGYSTFSRNLTIPSYSDQKSDIIDTDDMRYTLHVSSDNVTEEHKLSYLNVPVKVVMFKKVSDKILLTGGCGLKVGIPISTKFRLEESNFTTEAFYPDLNFLLKDHEPLGLYSNRKDWHPEGDLESELNVAILAEGGVILPFKDDIAINASAYFSYGLNKSIKGKTNKHLVEEYAKYNGFQSFVGDAGLMQIGIKIGIIGVL